MNLCTIGMRYWSLACTFKGRKFGKSKGAPIPYFHLAPPTKNHQLATGNTT